MYFDIVIPFIRVSPCRVTKKSLANTAITKVSGLSDILEMYLGS